MNITGERTIPARQNAVWDALNNPDVLRQCIPGCDEMERVSETEYRLGMLAVVGPVKARFSGKLQLSDIVAPDRYALRFEGSGGVAGFGKGTANVALAATSDAQTQLTYTADAQIGGKIAQVGSRLIDGIARKIAEEFFTRFEVLLTDAQAAQPAEFESAAIPDSDGTAPHAQAAAKTLRSNETAVHDTRPQRSTRLIGWSAGIAVVVIAVVVLALQHSS